MANVLTRLLGLNTLEGLLKLSLQQQENILANLATLQANVTRQDTVIDSAVTLLQGLGKEVADLKPDQAAIDALAADIQARTDALAAAVTANTPAA